MLAMKEFLRLNNHATMLVVYFPTSLNFGTPMRTFRTPRLL